MLLDHGCHVQAYDPAAENNMRKIFPTITYTESAYEALTGADACLLMTEWPEFKELDLAIMGQIMTSKILIDMRGIFTKQSAPRQVLLLTLSDKKQI